MLEEFSEVSIRAAIKKLEGLELAKSNNRSVLGSLNEFAQHLEWYAEYEGIIDGEALRPLVWRVNHMPLVGPLGGEYAINVYKRQFIQAI